ncbi:MAG: ABC transporter permease [Anaerolineae bacterium]
MILRICNLVFKEFIQFRRDWLLATFIITLPLLQLVLLAETSGRGLKHFSMAVLDLDNSRLSRQLVTALDNTQELDARYYPHDAAEMRRLLDRGLADLAVVIPRGFTASWDSPHSSSQIQVIADGSNSIVGGSALSAAEGVLTNFAFDMALCHRAYVVSPINLRTTIRFNRTLNIRHYTLPAQLGFVVYQITLMVASLAFARERELGTLEQLLVAPLRRAELVIGKVIPALVIGTVNFLVLLAVTVFGFGVPFRGSFPLLLALTLLFIVAESGWGVVISCFSRTQQQAILFVFLQAMTDMTFSGYLVPVSNMPWLMQALSVFVPLRHYLTIVRNIMIKGASLSLLWPQVVALALLSSGILVIGLVSLQRRLE